MKKKRTNYKMVRKYKRRRALVKLFTVLVMVFACKGLFTVGKLIAKTPIESLPIEEVSTCRYDNKYFYNFIYSLDVADKYDSREILHYIMKINEMESVDDYYNVVTLKVPVLESKENNTDILVNK